MRATRAYIAGFGTAGSLVAGAALVFVTASAVVAFRGWPQVANTAAPATLVVSAHHVLAASRAERSLVAVAAIPAARTSATATTAPGVATIGTSRTVAHDRTPQTGTQVTAVGGRPAAHVATVTVPPTGTTSTPSGSCTPACLPSLPTGAVVSTVQNATGALGTAVAGTGKSVASTITGVVGTVASKLSGVNQALGSTVNQVGNVLGGTVSQATSAAGGVISGAGKALGGALSGLSGH